MKNEITSPTRLQHKPTQIRATLEAFSNNPASLKMISKETGIKYRSVCWRSWELTNRNEIFCVGRMACPVTGRISKFFMTKINSPSKN